MVPNAPNFSLVIIWLQESLTCSSVCKCSFFFVVVTCNKVKLRVVYVLSLSFNVVTCSAMFVFPVLCAIFVVVVFRSKWYCFSSRV